MVLSQHKIPMKSHRYPHRCRALWRTWASPWMRQMRCDWSNHMHLQYITIYIYIWLIIYVYVYVYIYMYYTYIHTYIHACMHADRQTDRQAGRQTDRQAGRQTYIHTYTHIHIYNHTCLYTHTRLIHGFLRQPHQSQKVVQILSSLKGKPMVLGYSQLLGHPKSETRGANPPEHDVWPAKWRWVRFLNYPIRSMVLVYMLTLGVYWW